MSETTDLLIVGGGPAGMAAAETAHAHGLTVTVVDEQAARGGQFLRQPPAEFSLVKWLPGKTYRKARNLLARSETLHEVDWLMRSAVAGIFPINHEDAHTSEFRVLIEAERSLHERSARTVLVAGGCYDLPVTFPGWTTPGVMAAGGIQAFIKSQQFVPGQRFVLSGSHPLQLVIADQIVQAGGEVVAVLFAQSASRAFGVLRKPALLWRHGAKFSQVAGILKRLRKAGVRVEFNKTVLQAHGDESLQAVTIAAVDADCGVRAETTRKLECDRLGVCFGFLSSTELVRQADAHCRWNASRGGWIAEHDDWMSSSVPGLFVAGESTGVSGSDCAIEEGHLAALGSALATQKMSPAKARQLAKPIRRKLRHLNDFAAILSELSWPGDEFFDQLVRDESILCKCEELTAGEVLRCLQLNPEIQSASSAKLLTRAGMGICQGRYCHHALTRLLARTHQMEESDVAGFTSRFPAKPLSIGNLVDLVD